MSVIYRFEVIGKSGGTLAGYLFGVTTVEQALAAAIADLVSGRTQPLEICQDGQVVYDAAQIATLAKDEGRRTKDEGQEIIDVPLPREPLSGQAPGHALSQSRVARAPAD